MRSQVQLLKWCLIQTELLLLETGVAFACPVLPNALLEAEGKLANALTERAPELANALTGSAPELANALPGHAPVLASALIEAEQLSAVAVLSQAIVVTAHPCGESRLAVAAHCCSVALQTGMSSSGDVGT